jgi:beta-glucosidase-like glycosyl hydrolase
LAFCIVKVSVARAVQTFDKLRVMGTGHDQDLQRPDPDRWVDTVLGRLSPREKLAQRVLVLPGVADGGPDPATRQALQAGVGALHSVTTMAASAAARYHNAVLEVCADATLPPALISGNLESGVAYSLGSSGTHFPYPRGLGIAGDAELAGRVASDCAAEARSLGYHWTFSPCADVVTVPDDPVLGVRAFGVPPGQTAALVAAQVRGYQAQGVLATAKHFPGHGDSSVDSHHGLPCIARNVTDHERVHLPPFQAAVAAGVASIMVAHLTLPRLGIDEPASLSATVNRQWLRQELGFAGLIVTDSLRMNAISDRYGPAEAALLALRAGADVANVKCPAAEAPRIIAHLLAALADGALSESELDDSVRRLLLARVRIGLDEPMPLSETAAARLDAPAAWSDPARPRTVHPPAGGRAPRLSRDAPHVVVGDSTLARRVAELGRDHGFRFVWDPTRVTPGALATVAARHPGASLIPVVCPGPVMTATERTAIAHALDDPAVRGRVAAAVVNSGAPATSFPGLGDRVVSAPAVDVFGVVTDAAILAALDVLG